MRLFKIYDRYYDPDTNLWVEIPVLMQQWVAEKYFKEFCDNDEDVQLIKFSIKEKKRIKNHQLYNRKLLQFLKKFKIGNVVENKRGEIYQIIGITYWDCNAVKNIDDPLKATGMFLATFDCMVIKNHSSLIPGECCGFSADIFNAEHQNVKIIAWDEPIPEPIHSETKKVTYVPPVKVKV
jgi:hypothetical protein